MALKTYSFQLRYPGPQGGGGTGCEDPVSNRWCSAMRVFAELTFDVLKLKWKIEHYWPGDLHYQIRTSRSLEALEKLLEDAFNKSGVYVSQMTQVFKRKPREITAGDVIRAYKTATGWKRGPRVDVVRKRSSPATYSAPAISAGMPAKYDEDPFGDS